MTHDMLLDRYAQLAIRSGLNLQKGQQLVVTAPLDAVALVRRITEHAYKAGASLVTTLYSDDLATLALDILVDEYGYSRSGPNLLLAPGGG